MWILAIGLSALMTAVAEDQREQATRQPQPSRPRLPGPTVQSGQLAFSAPVHELGMERRPTRVFEIGGELVQLLNVEPLGPGWAEVTVHHIDDDEEREYYLFDSAQRAGELARQFEKEELLHGIDSKDPVVQSRAFDHVVNMIGKDTLVRWALGLPAGPGKAKVHNLEEWLDLSLQHPQEHWGSYDGEEHEVSPVEEDYNEPMILLGESAWQDLLDALEAEPTVAYRR